MTWFESDVHTLWLRTEGARLLGFGRRCAPTPNGAAWLDDTGTPDVSRPVHTWITCRMAHVHALAHLQGVPGAGDLAGRLVGALVGPARDPRDGGWVESLDADGHPHDDRKVLYTHAFVVLAGASAATAGLPGGRELLAEALSVLDERFWEDDTGAHRDTWDRGFEHCEDYRGANGNMHAVEALLAASDATGEARWRERALRIAARLIDGGARARAWRVPEHFDGGWTPLPEFNADSPDDPFKPYGATVGHGLEWSRLLLHLEAALQSAGQSAPAWLREASTSLYERAVTDGWAVDGAPGFVYTTGWDGRPLVRTRMHWVVAEAVGAAAALHRVSGQVRYADDYARWWDYAETYVIDRDGGSWRHELDAANRPSAVVWPGKPDLYHAYQATVLPLVRLDVSLAQALSLGAAWRQSPSKTLPPLR